MDKSEAIVKRQTNRLRFRNEDMDYFLNWVLGTAEILGLSHGEIFYAVSAVKDGDPTSWRQAFDRQGRHLVERARQFSSEMHAEAAGQSFIAASAAYGAALQFTDPATPDFTHLVAAMEEAFGAGAAALHMPISPVEVPFESGHLPAYYLEHDSTSRPTVVMIGGSDTFREDLFYFAGYPGWKRGYNVLMVDLPGQGKTPADGLHFHTDMGAPINAAVSWLETNAAIPPDQIALYGVSGGGYFTAQAAAQNPNVGAWIASPPIVDMAAVFEKEFGAARHVPGWLFQVITHAAGTFNKSADMIARKYAWKYGTTDFAEAIEKGIRQAPIVGDRDITCPALLLVGDGEGEELLRQSRELFARLEQRGQDVTIREFHAQDGADAHCQVNNLRLAHLVVFDWLDRVFKH